MGETSDSRELIPPLPLSPEAARVKAMSQSNQPKLQDFNIPWDLMLNGEAWRRMFSLQEAIIMSVPCLQPVSLMEVKESLNAIFFGGSPVTLSPRCCRDLVFFLRGLEFINSVDLGIDLDGIRLAREAFTSYLLKSQFFLPLNAEA